MKSLTLNSPAKLNLFLHITGKRADGYHELQTIFQLIDAHDIMHFDSNHTGRITLNINANETLTTHIEDNLVYKAAQALKDKLPEDTFGCHISLTKYLPTGGGIGGGSSNAATTLLALNTLWQLNMPLTDLADIGAKLGADVPVFINGFQQTGAAWAEGIGEKLTPCDTSKLINPKQYIVVLKPDVHASTAALFQHAKLVRNSTHVKRNDVLDYPKQFSERYQNAFEPVVTDLYPDIAAALNYLQDFQQKLNIQTAVSPRLTGSGACVFAVFAREVDAQTCLDNAPCSGFICQPLSHSVIHRKLS